MEIDPAFGSDFFGRDNITSILFKRVEAFRNGYHRNIGLVGSRYIGKSSILQNFILSANYPDIIPIYIEFSEETFSDTVKRWMGMMLVGFFQSKNETIPESIDGLIKKAKRELPKTTRKMLQIRSLLKKGKYNEAYCFLLCLTAVLHEETGQRIVMIMDEFHLLNSHKLKDPFSVFGNQIMIQKEVLFIVSSSLEKVARDIFSEKLALLFGNFEVLEIDRYDYPTSDRFISDRLSSFQISRSLKRFIIRLTDGHPFYLAVICQEIKTTLEQLGLKRFNTKTCAFMLEKVLFQGEGVLSQHFSARFLAMFPGRKSSSINVLMSIALGHKKIRDLSRYMGARQDEVKKALTKLNHEGVISKSGHFYYIDDPLLSFWLKNVYYLKRTALRVNKQMLVAEFRKRVVSLAEEFNVEDKKGIAKRVEELFRSFKNEVVCLEKKKETCPDFTRILMRDASQHGIPILAKALRSKWVCQLMTDQASEDDVQAFVEKTSLMKAKNTKRILIIPYGIGIDASLLAKECKVSLIKLKELNHLMELYDKPKLVLSQKELAEKSN